MSLIDQWMVPICVPMHCVCVQPIYVINEMGQCNIFACVYHHSLTQISTSSSASKYNLICKSIWIAGLSRSKHHLKSKIHHD